MRKLLYFKELNYTKDNMQLLFDNFEVVASDNDIDCDAAILPLGEYWDGGFFMVRPKLQVVASNTTTADHIDTEYCREYGIDVITLEGDPVLDDITAVAELTIGLIIALTRNIIPAAASVEHRGEWFRWPYGRKKMLRKTTLGIIGYGRIGNHVSRFADGLYMDLAHYDISGEYADFIEDVLDVSDIVTVHIPLKGNEKLFDRKIFEQFKDGAYFINTSRGEIVDDEALIWALESGKLTGAAVDVLSGEFKPGFDADKHPLVQYARGHDNLIITPHIGGSTEDAWEMTQRAIVEKLIAYFKR